MNFIKILRKNPSKPELNIFWEGLKNVAQSWKRFYQTFVAFSENLNFVILSIGTDLALLAMCDHIIISHGTYGMWAAFLASSTNTHIMVKLTTCFHEFFEYKYTICFSTKYYVILEIKPCGLGSRIRGMEAESHNWSHFLMNLW